jgi:hypothetical protein
LTDIFGNDIPDCERDIPEIDGPESWPVCVEFDAIHYEISDPTEAAEIERLAVEAECDRRDAPPLSQVSDVELSMLAAHGAI